MGNKTLSKREQVLMNPPLYSNKKEEGMKTFDHLLHQYWSDDNSKKAEVYLTNEGYGCRYYENKVWKQDIVYKDHSESYAESAAENYVLGILQL